MSIDSALTKAMARKTAFPSAIATADGNGLPLIMGEIAGMEGMTLREYYAGQALAGLLALDRGYTQGMTAQIAVQMTDALIAELAK